MIVCATLFPNEKLWGFLNVTVALAINYCCYYYYYYSSQFGPNYCVPQPVIRGSFLSGCDITPIPYMSYTTYGLSQVYHTPSTFDTHLITIRLKISETIMFLVVVVCMTKLRSRIWLAGVTIASRSWNCDPWQANRTRISRYDNIWTSSSFFLR